MKLVQFSIDGFRGYQEETVINIDDITSFVGKNDAGKSSIMDALDLFFDDSKKLDREDICVSSQEDEVILKAKFKDFPSSVTLDTSSITTLQDEQLLFKDGEEEYLCIEKRYSGGKAATVYILATCPTIPDCDHPIILKQTPLRTLGRSLSLEESIPSDARNSNPPWRKAILNYYSETPVKNSAIPVANDDAKKIWAQVKPHIPYFCLFKVDRDSSDQDNEAKDPLAYAAKIAVSQHQKAIDDIIVSVEKSATDLIDRTLNKLQEMAPELAVALSADLTGKPKWDGFKTSLKTEGNVPFNKRGSGTKRLVLLNFFRAEAERLSQEDGRGVIYGFEEPESSQHPENQILLIESFLKISALGRSQVVLTTHAPLVAKNLPTDSLRLVCKDAETGKNIVEQGTNDGIISRIANELGVVTDSRIRVLVMVEGPNDVEFFRNIYNSVCEIDSNVYDLTNCPYISVVPVGGGNLQHWVSKKYLSGTSCIEYHIYDRDCDNNSVPKYQEYVDLINNEQNLNSGRITTKRETENYIHSDCIQEAISIPISTSDYLDIPKIVSDATKQSTSINDMGEGNVKKVLNTVATSKMTGARLKLIDPSDEIVGWFREIKVLVDESATLSS